MADADQETQVRFSLTGKVLPLEGLGEASLCIAILPMTQAESKVGREELDAAKKVATKLDSSGPENGTIERLKFIMEKINSVRDMLDEASQVCRVYFCSAYHADERHRRSIRSQASRGRSSQQS